MDVEPTVWVVDDDPKVKDALCALLRAKQYRARQVGADEKNQSQHLRTPEA